MVFGKLIGKSVHENLRATTTFQSFDDDSNELGDSRPGQLLPERPLTLKSRDRTNGEAGAGGLASPSFRRKSLLRAPSFNGVSCSNTTGCGHAADNRTCEVSECSAETASSWCSYGIEEIPDQFHMSSACTVDAPAQFVVPTSTLVDADGVGSDSNSSLLCFTPILGDEYYSVRGEDETSCIPDDSSQKSGKSIGKQLKREARKPKKIHGNRLKRRSDDRVVKTRIDETSEKIHSAKEAARTKSSVVCNDREIAATLSPCPRSPAKNLRNFKRTSAITQANEADQIVDVKENECQLPTNGMKAQEKLSLINLIDSSKSLTTPVRYAVDLHRLTPIKQRQKYILGEKSDELLSPVEMVGGVVEPKPPQSGSRRGSLQHVPLPRTTNYPRRLSCPMNSGENDSDENGDAFERVIGLIGSHSREVNAGDSRTEVMATPSRRKKSTVEDLKRKLQKDRERNEEKRLQCNVESKRAAVNRRLNSPRRMAKGRRLPVASRRQLEPAPL